MIVVEDLHEFVSHVSDAKSSFDVYPNPANGYIHVVNIRTEEFQITDMQGNMVKKGTLEAGKQTVSLSGLCKGAYIFITPTATIRLAIE
ncbi:MAG: T9SS type A sorting domain-containing protein [Cytophagales bacterium]|nr:T9SS type A sorting domain-containing protein [Cytophagales bacterium]